MDIIPIILAGGVGNRLWPLSNEDIPKQFIKFNNNLSFFQSSLIRNKFLGKPIIIINQKHLNIVKEQISEINIEAYIIVEQSINNTANSIFIALTKAKDLGFTSIIILPSDHYIIDENSYSDIILENYKKFSEKILMIGITTNIPTTEYGYINTAKQIDANIFQVKKFIEKPNINDARKFCSSKNYFWNSGIFISTIEFILNKFFILIPDLSFNSNNILINKNNIFFVDVDNYKPIKNISLDKAIIEKIPANEIMMIHGKFDWQDIGSWNSILTLLQKDKNNNYTQGNIISCKTNNSSIISNDKIIYTFGINNLMIINSNNMIFIIDKSKII